MSTITRFESGPRMSQAVVHGDTIYLAGQVGPTGETVAEQTASALAEVDRLLDQPRRARLIDPGRVADLADAATVPLPTVSAIPPLVLGAAGMFVPMLRELRETDYQRDRPFLLDDRAARDAFGLEPTPWADLLAAQVAAYRPTKEAITNQ